MDFYIGLPVQFDVLFSSEPFINDGIEEDDGGGFGSGLVSAEARTARLLTDLSVVGSPTGRRSGFATIRSPRSAAMRRRPPDPPARPAFRSRGSLFGRLQPPPAASQSVRIAHVGLTPRKHRAGPRRGRLRPDAGSSCAGSLHALPATFRAGTRSSTSSTSWRTTACGRRSVSR